MTRLAAIVDEFMPVVLGAAYGLSGDWDIAGDVAQEVFATLVVRVGICGTRRRSQAG